MYWKEVIFLRKGRSLPTKVIELYCFCYPFYSYQKVPGQGKHLKSEIQSQKYKGPENISSVFIQEGFGLGKRCYP